MKYKLLVIALLIVLASVAYISYNMFLQKEEMPRIEGTKILVILYKGFDTKEYQYVRENIEKQGGEVIVASFTKEPIVGQGGAIVPDVTVHEVDLSEINAIFIPGGNSPRNIISHPDSEVVYELVRKAYSEGKIIAAICHGPWVLAKAGVVEGKKVMGHDDVVADLKKSGGIITGGLVVRDGNIITAQFEGLDQFTR